MSFYWVQNSLNFMAMNNVIKQKIIQILKKISKPQQNKNIGKTTGLPAALSQALCCKFSSFSHQKFFCTF